MSQLLPQMQQSKSTEKFVIHIFALRVISGLGNDGFTQ
jgi:hypothetical protein